MQTQDDAVTAAWVKSYPVQQALKQVGEPDGSGEWGFNFAQALLKATDEGARITRDADRMAYLAQRWEQLEAKLSNGHVGGAVPTQVQVEKSAYGAATYVPTQLLEQMLEILSLPQLALYLNTTERKLVGYLFPLSDPEALFAGLFLRRGGKAIRRAAQMVGVSFAVLARYLDYMREPTPLVTCSDGRVQRSPVVRQRILDLSESGLGHMEVLERIKAEMPEETQGITYAAVKQIIWRARQAAA